VIAGLRRTRRSVVERLLKASGVVSGAPFARDRVVDAQRQLYELGLFRTVELLPMPGQERRDVRGLVVHCEEGAQRRTCGRGLERDRPLAADSRLVAPQPLRRRPCAVAEGRLSSNEERFQIGLREPRVPYLDLPGYLVVYRPSSASRTAVTSSAAAASGSTSATGAGCRSVPGTATSTSSSSPAPSATPRSTRTCRARTRRPALRRSRRPWSGTSATTPAPEPRQLLAALARVAYPFFAADANYLKLFGARPCTAATPTAPGPPASGSARSSRSGPTTGAPNLQVRSPAATSPAVLDASRLRARPPRHPRPDPGRLRGADRRQRAGARQLRVRAPGGRVFSGVAFVDIGNVWPSPSWFEWPTSATPRDWGSAW